MKKKKMLVLLGMSLFMLGIGLNVQYALDDYGVVKNSLHMEVLAQSNSSGDGSGSGSGSGTGSGFAGWWNNTDFFAHLTTKEIYEHNANIAVGYKGFNIELGSITSGFIGYLRTCEFHMFDTCDKNKEGFSKVSGSGT